MPECGADGGVGEPIGDGAVGQRGGEALDAEVDACRVTEHGVCVGMVERPGADEPPRELAASSRVRCRTQG